MGLYALGITAAVKPGYATWEIDTYRAGRQTTTKIGDFAIWEGVKTPGAIRDEVARINDQIKQTGTDLFKELEEKGAFPPDLNDRPESVLPLVKFYEASWSPFAQEWQVYLVEHGPGSSYFNNFWGAAWEGAQDRLRQLQKLRDQAKSVGFGLKTSPDIVEPERSGIGQAGSDLWGMFKTLFYLGIFMVAGIALVQVARMVR